MSRARGANELVMAAQNNEVVGVGHVRVMAAHISRCVAGRLNGDVINDNVTPDSPRGGAHDGKAVITRLAGTAIGFAASSRTAGCRSAGCVTPLVIANEAEVGDDLVASAAGSSTGAGTAGADDESVVHTIVPAYAERNAGRRCGASIDGDVVQARVHSTAR